MLNEQKQARKRSLEWKELRDRVYVVYRMGVLGVRMPLQEVRRVWYVYAFLNVSIFVRKAAVNCKDMQHEVSCNFQKERGRVR